MSSEFFVDQPDRPRALITAHCLRCGRHAGTFYAHPGSDSGTWHGSCRCTTPPTMPAGAELNRLIKRARRRRSDHDHHAPVKIVVR